MSNYTFITNDKFSAVDQCEDMKDYLTIIRK